MATTGIEVAHCYHPNAGDTKTRLAQVKFTDTDYEAYWVECTYCGARGPTTADIEQSAKLWNAGCRR